MGTEREQKLTMHGLRHAAGYIQSKLAKRLQTRFTPVLTFVEDDGVKKSIEMTRLINEALGPAGAAEEAGAEAGEEVAEGTAGQDQAGKPAGPEGSPAT
jgi:ribosome-binding factor A